MDRNDKKVRSIKRHLSSMAKKYKVVDSLSINDVRDILHRYDDCYFCSVEIRAMTAKSITPIIPFYLGGDCCRGNIVVVCGPCAAVKERERSIIGNSIRLSKNQRTRIRIR